MDLNAIIFIFISYFFGNFAPVLGQYDDVRCKCVCPLKAPTVNSTDFPSRRVFVKSFHDPLYCKCENVLPVEMQTEKFCTRCDCQWQRRNTGTIKVIVIMIVCMISLLLIYMVFLICLDPLLNWKQRTQYEPQIDTASTSETRSRSSRLVPPLQEEIDQTNVFGTSRQRPGVIWRVKEEMKKVQGEQEKWMDTVEEQRRHVYDKHSFLN